MTLPAWARFSFVIVAAVTLQIAVLNNLVVANAHPDVLLLVAIAAGLVVGPQDGAVAAFALGLVADLFVDLPYGASALTYVLLAFGVGMAVSGQRDRLAPGLQLAVAVVASATGTLLYAGVGYILGQPAILRANIPSIVLVVTVGNAVLALPVVATVKWAIAERQERPGAAVSGARAR